MDKTKYIGAWDAIRLYNNIYTVFGDDINNKLLELGVSNGPNIFEIKLLKDYNFKISEIKHIISGNFWKESKVNVQLFKYNGNYYVSKYRETSCLKNNNFYFNANENVKMDTGVDLSDYIRGNVCCVNNYDGNIIDDEYVMENIVESELNIDFGALVQIVRKLAL